MVKLINSINKVSIDNEKCEQVEKVYRGKLPELAKKIITYGCKGKCIAGVRFLSLPEILEADSDLHINFIKQSRVPLIDTYDNDFIVFNLKSKQWEKMNIVENIVFLNSKQIIDLL